mgnify:CR=1 FL=1
MNLSTPTCHLSFVLRNVSISWSHVTLHLPTTPINLPSSVDLHHFPLRGADFSRFVDLANFHDNFPSSSSSMESPSISACDMTMSSIQPYMSTPLDTQNKSQTGMAQSVTLSCNATFNLNTFMIGECHLHVMFDPHL